LAVIPDLTHHGAIYVAESAATVKRVVLVNSEITHTYRGPKAPLTSLSLSADGKTLYAGCWDKTIWCWDVTTCEVRWKNQRHTDFVKSVLFLKTPQGQDILISGGAEGDILIWNASTAQWLGSVKGQSHAIQDIILDPLQEDLTLFASFSDPGIRQFTISDLKNSQRLAFSEPIHGHDTSVYKLFFDSDGDLWTASADKTAKHLVRSDDWKADTTLNHPDFVRDIVVHDRYGWVITACRDEEVRVWSLATGELHHTFSGHFEEVTGLCLVGDTVVSISIDATIRQWSLAPRDLQRAKDEATNPKQAEEDAKLHKQQDDKSALTEEEERELKELMENEERELQELIANDEQ
jgi:WD40 repeat protein